MRVGFVGTTLSLLGVCLLLLACEAPMESYEVAESDEPSSPVPDPRSEDPSPVDESAVMRDLGVVLTDAALAGVDAFERALRVTAADAFDPECAPLWAHQILDSVADDSFDIDRLAGGVRIADVLVPLEVQFGRAVHLGGDCEGPLPRPDSSETQSPTEAPSEEQIAPPADANSVDSDESESLSSRVAPPDAPRPQPDEAEAPGAGQQPVPNAPESAPPATEGPDTVLTFTDPQGERWTPGLYNYHEGVDIVEGAVTSDDDRVALNVWTAGRPSNAPGYNAHWEMELFWEDGSRADARAMFAVSRHEFRVEWHWDETANPTGCTDSDLIALVYTARPFGFTMSIPRACLAGASQIRFQVMAQDQSQRDWPMDFAPDGARDGEMFGPGDL